MKKAWIIGLVCSGIALGAAAEDTAQQQRRNRERKGCEELKRLRAEQRETRQNHFDRQKQENKTFRQGLKDTDAENRGNAILAHRREQYAENVQLHEDFHAARINAVSACDEIPDDKKQEILQHMNSRHNETRAFHDGVHEDVIAGISDIINSDASPQEKKQSMKELRTSTRNRVREWRQERRGTGKRARNGNA